MTQVFSPKHIRRYLFAYLGITLLLILFFLLNHFYNPTEKHAKKNFEATHLTKEKIESQQEKSSPANNSHFKLLDKAY